MFSLIKHECEYCMEESDCVHCTRCKSYYCRECIIEYNNCNKTTGLCPTCKSKYGMMNNYYIHGTNVLPLLSAQIDKYRERIQSNETYRLQQLFDQLKSDNAKGICNKRSALLQLYLNRLYVDQHPTKRKSLHTWAKGVHEADVVMDIFDDFRFAVDAFLANHPDDAIRDIVIRYNREFDHINWEYVNNRRRTWGPVHDISTIYIKRVHGQNPLQIRAYRDITDKLQEFIVREEGIEVNDFIHGASSALIESGLENMVISGITYKNVDVEPHDHLSKFNPDNSPVAYTNNKEASNSNKFIMRSSQTGVTSEYVVFKLIIDKRFIKVNPFVCDLREIIGTCDYNKEMQYYRGIANEIAARIDELIANNRENNEPIDDSYYHLLHSISAIEGYTNPGTDDVAKTLKESILELVKSDTFNTRTFLALLDAYYPLSGKFDFVEDLKPIVDEIKKQLFDDPSLSASTFDNTIRPLLKLNEKPKDKRFYTNRSEKLRYVTLPDTLQADLKDVLAKSNSKHKLSFIRCVCGGSVIATTNGTTTVYECTRCHKQLDALPEQEMDPETAKLLESISKKCPVCGTYIQKAEGCNHMFCTNCKNGFNWNDLSHLDDAHNTNPHFREHRHGNVSNLRSLLDDYDRPANRATDPIEWFCNKLYANMKAAEKAIKDHRERAGTEALKFIRDDEFAMKFANALNIKKMCVNYIQSTFDKVMAEAFNVVRENGSNQHALRREYKKIVTRSLRDYENGKTMLIHIHDGIAARIDYAIEEAQRLSQVSESAELVTDEMEAEAIALEEALKAQLSARIEEMDKQHDDVIMIGNHRISVRRS